MKMLLLSSLVYYDDRLLWKRVDGRGWMKSIPTEMVSLYTVFIYYSLISDESITVAFGQTQMGNSVYEADFYR